MALTDVRDEFLRRSGRFDLGTIGGADNGANRFINRGQEYLDSRVLRPRQMRRHQVDIVAGQFVLTFTKCRSIQEVWVMDADGRTRLEKQDLATLRDQYEDAYGSNTAGRPAYYAPAVIGLSPDQRALTLGAGANVYTGQFTRDYEDIMFADEGAHYAYSGILWMPPADGGYTIQVWANFYENILTDTAGTTTNYWTEVKPEALVLAALYKLETAYRNTQGAADWLGALELEVMGIEKDAVEEEIVELDHMGG